MVLVAVDDLLFSSKIRTVARQAGVEVSFARTPADILERARADRPRLIIFDLNSGKTDPVDTIAALKGDPALAHIPTLGFASHVHADLINAARRAGAERVLPRSAFAGNLADILRSTRTPSP
jgi:DNA-binding NarL/FixJ family response regulator